MKAKTKVQVYDSFTGIDYELTLIAKVSRESMLKEIDGYDGLSYTVDDIEDIQLTSHDNAPDWVFDEAEKKAKGWELC